MACTTILAGKKATYNGSTFIARNEDSGSGEFSPKKMIVVEPEEQPRHYESVLSHVKIELPDNPMRYTAMPNADPSEGIWAAAGVNAANVSMTATETITSNPLVQAADPMVVYHKAENEKPEQIGGIGEEDLVSITLPYIQTAREGVLRLGSLLEQYGTYEMNGIAFQDVDEVWWLETIGGHHWIAKRVPDDEYVVMPNQFGIDEFDLEDAFGSQKEHLCSADLREFIAENHLDLSLDGTFHARLAFGSHSDSDHSYNTPRAWFIERYFNPRTFQWDGEDADYRPTDDDIAWSLIPEHKITVEEMKYALSGHFQFTPYDPYAHYGNPDSRGEFRPIGISRNNVLTLTEIRPDLPKDYQVIEWIAYGSNTFNAFVPLYANVDRIPEYFGNTTTTVSTEKFYWANRLIGALSDSHFQKCQSHIERYQNAVAEKGRTIIAEYDRKLRELAPDLTPAKTQEEVLSAKSGAAEKQMISVMEEANQKIADMTKKETDEALDHVLYEASCEMKNGYSRSDA